MYAMSKYKDKYQYTYLQEAQLLQTGRVMLPVIEYFAKSLHSRSFKMTCLSKAYVSPY